MNKGLLNIYIILYVLSFYLFYLNFDDIYKYKGWFLKCILLVLAGFIITCSIFYDNKIINKNVMPILILLNIAILIFVTFNNKYNYVNLIPIIGILYILSEFNMEDFHFNKGKLIKPNKEWIYLHIVALITYYILSNKNILEYNSKIGCILLVLYPLLFPLNEYFIHRIFSLCIMVHIAWLY